MPRHFLAPGGAKFPNLIFFYYQYYNKRISVCQQIFRIVYIGGAGVRFIMKCEKEFRRKCPYLLHFVCRFIIIKLLRGVVMYAIENYQKQERFHKCYKEISRFLRNNADSGFNEHFHWGRLDWMMAHPCLDVEMLPKITVFKDSGGTIVGTALFDTEYENGWYVLHSVSDEKLLRQMTAYINDVDSAPTIKANLNDIALCKLLEEMNFKKQFSEYVLAVNLSHDLSYRLPTGFCINEQNAPIDEWQWRLVIHRGFDHDGIPQTLSGEAAEAEKHLQTKEYIKTFAIKNGEYAAHCGLWYNGGETAYIEPVATVPEYRRKGLGKAVVYEALRRAKNQGAKRAIVISEQDFYQNIGMSKSSEVVAFVK
jgi:predicted N-acetyltransferase YhbS